MDHRRAFGLVTLAVAVVAVVGAMLLFYQPLRAREVPVLRQACGSAAHPGGAYNSEGGDCWGAVHGRRMEVTLVLAGSGVATVSGVVLTMRRRRRPVG